MKRIAILVAALSVFSIFTENSSAYEVKNYAGFVGIQDCETKSVVTTCGGPSQSTVSAQNFYIALAPLPDGTLFGSVLLRKEHKQGYSFQSKVTVSRKAASSSEVVEVYMIVKDPNGAEASYVLTTFEVQTPADLSPMVLVGQPIQYETTKWLTPFVFLGPENEMFNQIKIPLEIVKPTGTP